METKLARISQLSKENPDMVFTSLGHLINKEMLQSCHLQMDGEKAVGIDGVTKEEYSRNLDENIENLIERLKKKSYKPKPARLVEIPKDNGKTRPLSIYDEMKIVFVITLQASENNSHSKFKLEFKFQDTLGEKRYKQYDELCFFKDGNGNIHNASPLTAMTYLEEINEEIKKRHSEEH